MTFEDYDRPRRTKYSAWDFEIFLPSSFTSLHFLRNILVVGSVGSGKTSFVKILLRRALDFGDILVLDVKGEYRDLITTAREASRSGSVLAVGRDPLLKLNPLEPPPRVSTSAWVGRVADIITRCYGLGEPSRRILQDCIEVLYREHDLHGVGAEVVTWPTLRELEKKVAEFPVKGSRESNSRRALESRLHLMTTGELGKSLNTMVGFDPAFFSDRIVSVELDWTTNLRDQRVLGELLVSGLWEYRKANPQVRERLHVVVFEEAHRFVPEARTSWDRGSRTLLEQCFAEGRAYGFGLVAVDQQPSLLSRYVIANTGSKFSGRLASPADAQLIISALQMQRMLGAEPMLRKLLPGDMFAQVLFTRDSIDKRVKDYKYYRVPFIHPLESPSDRLLTSEADAIYTEKLQSALIDTFNRHHKNKDGRIISPLLMNKIETFIRLQISPCKEIVFRGRVNTEK